MLTLATEATMFQPPRLRSALRRLTFAALPVATASPPRIGRAERGDTLHPSLDEESTRFTGVPAAGAVELSDLGNETWSALFSHSPIAAPPLLAPPFVEVLARTWRDGHRPCMIAGYDDGNALLIDFARREVRADPRAWERLLARGELPRMADQAFPLQGPTYRAERHPIESLVWAVGLASASLPLLGAPAAWRSARLSGRGWQDFASLSCAPAHLHLAELASRGETTPQQLRRATRVDERTLRAFLQAVLFLRLLEWTR